MKRQFLLHKSSTTEATVVQKAFWTNAYGWALAPWDGRFNLSKDLKHLAESVLRKLESFLPFFSWGPLVGGPVDQVPGGLSDAEPWRLLHTALHRHHHLQQASTYGPPTRSYAGEFTPIMSPPLSNLQWIYKFWLCSSRRFQKHPASNLQPTWVPQCLGYNT